jgi:hypothetical protein
MLLLLPNHPNWIFQDPAHFKPDPVSMATTGSGTFPENCANAFQITAEVGST